jgi:Ni/Fe-hydrogenase subunit HybB-like protein
MSTPDTAGTTLINRWQRGVPVYRDPVITGPFVFFSALAVIGFGLALVRFFSPLGPFSGMNDAYAWGIWKSFNVMTLTALGSGALAVGMAAWVFNRTRLHIVMRTAMVTGFLFYTTGLVALLFDVGRPWNFWNIVLVWRWNTHSAMLEVAVCMLLYASVFLLFENVPLVLERFYYTGGEGMRATLRGAAPALRRIYPFMLTGAYVLPLMHQSSLGGLLLLAGDKIHPLWQTPVLPLLYLLAAGVAGLAFVTQVLLFSCLRWSRPLEFEVLGELGNVLSWVSVAFVTVRFADLAWRRQVAAAVRLDTMSVLFLVETALILLPAIALRARAVRQTARRLLNVSLFPCLGALLFRFVPTTVAFAGGPGASYFPTLPEVLMTAGYISLGVVAFEVAVKYFAVLPAETAEWHYVFKLAGRRRAAAALRRAS